MAITTIFDHLKEVKIDGAINEGQKDKPKSKAKLFVNGQTLLTIVPRTWSSSKKLFLCFLKEL